MPYAAFAEMALAAAAETLGTHAHRVTDLELHQPVFILPEDWEHLQAGMRALVDSGLPQQTQQYIPVSWFL